MENKTFRVTSNLWATQGQRFVNYIIDWVIQFGLAVLLLIGVGIVLVAMGDTAFFERIDNMGKLGEYAFGAVVTLIYYALFEAFLSRTIAKYITKTVVVMADGSKPDSGTIIKRTFCRLIPFNAFSFLGDGRGWHDTISDTYVVQKDLFEEKKRLFYSFEEIGAKEEN
ncbi:RDD family protein [Flavobacterium suncheonense]|uniref:RDD domain-containing protein n=1 Tax=Flavobacterium suncheonense GH29-5 = DSM 17707 TaxID=1121899 RepID=A0A0A2MN68_9FLAO|nr:RDD family protein [Flavobacterium suncheonense]KGO89705.1 hypothetical protein Q764_05785 [Flavobacterium suncheonense GH29-5 = DSM 17707]